MGSVDSAAESPEDEHASIRSLSNRGKRTKRRTTYREGTAEGEQLFGSPQESTPRVECQNFHVTDTPVYPGEREGEEAKGLTRPSTLKLGVGKKHDGPSRKAVSRSHKPEKLELEEEEESKSQEGKAVPPVGKPGKPRTSGQRELETGNLDFRKDIGDMSIRRYGPPQPQRRGRKPHRIEHPPPRDRK